MKELTNGEIHNIWVSICKGGGNFSRLDIQRIFTEMVSLKNSEHSVYKDLFGRISLGEIFILGFDSTQGMTIFGSRKPNIERLFRILTLDKN